MTDGSLTSRTPTGNPGARGGQRGPGRPTVLAVLNLPPPAHGASLKNQRMLEGDVARRVDFRVIPCAYAADLAGLGRFSVRKLARAAGYLARQLAGLLRRPDAGYMMLSSSGHALARDTVFMTAFRMARTPYVVHLPMLGLADGVAGRPVTRRLVTAGLRSAAAVIALNRLHRDELLGLVPGAPVVIVENGLPDIDPSGDPPLVTTPDRPTIVFLSNLGEAKGVFTLLDALPAVFERVPGARAVLAGPWMDAAAEARFRRAVRTAGLEGRVEHVGPVYDDAKLRVLAGATVFAFPSHADNAPNVVLEAMRQALPVVASRVGGVPEMVDDGVTGRLVQPADADALADALAHVLADPDRAAEMGRAGRARFLERYTLRRWEDELAAVILDAAGSA